MEQALQNIVTYDWGKSREPLMQSDVAIRRSFGRHDALQAIESSLLDILKSNAPLAAKRFACTRLGLAGTAKSVPVLAGMLSDPQTADMARYALEQLPLETVDDVLREALPKAKGRVQTGIVNSIGNRKDAKAVPLLADLLNGSDPMAACSAAAAMGKIADDQALQALNQARTRARGQVRNEILDACLRCADRLLAEKKKDRAMSLYKELGADDMPKPIRTAAMRGMFAAARAS